MSIKRSQQFMYFQNKLKHYTNLHKVKSSLITTLSKQHKQYIKYSKNNITKKVKQFFKNKQKVNENINLFNRIVNIAKSKRIQIQVQGNYSRNNIFAKDIRKKQNSIDILEKKISVQNEEIAKRIYQVKPSVGSLVEWGQDYRRHVGLKKHLSRENNSFNFDERMQLPKQLSISEQYRSLKNKTKYRYADNHKKSEKLKLVDEFFFMKYLNDHTRRLSEQSIK